MPHYKISAPFLWLYENEVVCQDQLEPTRHHRLSRPAHSGKSRKKLCPHALTNESAWKCFKSSARIKCFFPTVHAHSFHRGKHFLGVWQSKDTIYKTTWVKTRPLQGPNHPAFSNPRFGKMRETKEKEEEREEAKTRLPCIGSTGFMYLTGWRSTDSSQKETGRRRTQTF